MAPVQALREQWLDGHSDVKLARVNKVGRCDECKLAGGAPPMVGLRADSSPVRSSLRLVDAGAGVSARRRRPYLVEAWK